MNRITTVIGIILLILFCGLPDAEASETNIDGLELIKTISLIVRDTGDVIYITQASPGVIESGSYRHPYISLEGAMDSAEDGDNIIFLRGELNTYKVSGPILLSKKVLITGEPDEIYRSGDDVLFLPLKGIPLIIE